MRYISIWYHLDYHVHVTFILLIYVYHNINSQTIKHTLNLVSYKHKQTRTKSVSKLKISLMESVFGFTVLERFLI